MGDMRQRHLVDFDDHMDVIGHPAIGVVAMAEAFDAIAQEALEGSSITLGQEYRLAVVTASAEVIEGSTIVLSRLSSHRREDAKRTSELASRRPGTHTAQRSVEKIGDVRMGSRPDAGGRDSLVYQITASSNDTARKSGQKIVHRLTKQMKLTICL